MTFLRLPLLMDKLSLKIVEILMDPFDWQALETSQTFELLKLMMTLKTFLRLPMLLDKIVETLMDLFDW
jgi:hypothetical protein